MIPLFVQYVNSFLFLGIQIVYRVMTLFMSRLREMMLKSRSRLCEMYKVEGICRRVGLGDWFLLYQLGKNIDPLIFKEFLNDLFKQVEERNLD